MSEVHITHFDEHGEVHKDSITVSREQLGVNCWLPARFLGGTCDRFYICEYAEKAKCKATASSIAREKLPHDREEGRVVRGVATCAVCDNMIELNEGETPYHGDEGTQYAGKPVCDSCYDEDLCEPCGTVYRGDSDEPELIGSCRNETEGAFSVQWQSTDPWRGYYELQSEHYARVFTDAILSGHESEAMLRKLYDRLMERFEKAGVEYARAFCRSSNLFMTSLEIWVKKDLQMVLKAHLILADIKQQVNYDDPLYSTGILMGREELAKLKTILGRDHPIETDADLMKLVREKGQEVVEEVREAMQKGGNTRTKLREGGKRR